MIADVELAKAEVSQAASLIADYAPHSKPRLAQVQAHSKAWRVSRHWKQSLLKYLGLERKALEPSASSGTDKVLL